jgi:hypothetical protein
MCELFFCPQVVIMGDGQATQNDFIVKPNVRKVRPAAGVHTVRLQRKHTTSNFEATRPAGEAHTVKL